MSYSYLGWPHWNLRQSHIFRNCTAYRFKALRTIGNFQSRTQSQELYVAFKILYEYDFSTKLCGRKLDVTRNHDNENICNTYCGETQNARRLNLAAAKRLKYPLQQNLVKFR